MVIILPNKKTGLAALEEQLATKQLSELLNQTRSMEVEVYLPKFKVETTLDLEQHLSKACDKFISRDIFILIKICPSDWSGAHVHQRCRLLWHFHCRALEGVQGDPEGLH